MSKKNGFTIIELVIYLGLLGIFLVIMTNLFVATLNVRLESQNQSALQQDGRYLIQRLTYDLRRANQINLPLLGEQTNSLDLLINDNLVDKHFIYNLNNQNLILNINDEELALNSKDTQVTDLVFYRLGNSDINPQSKDTVQIKFTLRSTIIKDSGQEIKSYQTTVNLR